MPDSIPLGKSLNFPSALSKVTFSPEPLHVDTPRDPTGTHLPEIVVYEHADFAGAEWRTNLSYSYVGDDWNDKISSIIVVSGRWEFYVDANLQTLAGTLDPGYYRFVADVGIPNDSISSFRAIAL